MRKWDVVDYLIADAMMDTLRGYLRAYYPKCEIMQEDFYQGRIYFYPYPGSELYTIDCVIDYGNRKVHLRIKKDA